MSLIEKLTILGLVLVWSSHLIGVFTPEVGFDAVWYHLPVVVALIEARQLVFIPELYQSVNPLLSDLFFGFGYWLAGEVGAKLVAYCFGLGLIVVTVGLARQVVSRQWALLAALMVSTFQVVAWESSSFYVDVAKALWEVAALWALMRWQRQKSQKYLLMAALLFGASLGTKLFSLVLLPVMLVLVGFSDKKSWLRNGLLFLGVSVVIPLPFYAFSYYHTGTPWYSFNQHLGKIGEIGQDQHLFYHLLMRTRQLLDFWKELLFGKDYVSILLAIFSPLLIWYGNVITKHRQLLILSVWSVVQVAVWWYLPPLSTRYALSGFVTWMILLFWAIERYTKNRPSWPIYATIGLALVINMVPRAVVNYRSLQYLLGYQSKQEYIHQFYDGHIDQHLREWHQLP